MNDPEPPPPPPPPIVPENPKRITWLQAAARLQDVQRRPGPDDYPNNVALAYYRGKANKNPNGELNEYSIEIGAIAYLGNIYFIPKITLINYSESASNYFKISWALNMHNVENNIPNPDLVKLLEFYHLMSNSGMSELTAFGLPAENVRNGVGGQLGNGTMSDGESEVFVVDPGSLSGRAVVEISTHEFTHDLISINEDLKARFQHNFGYNASDGWERLLPPISPTDVLIDETYDFGFLAVAVPYDTGQRIKAETGSDKFTLSDGVEYDAGTIGRGQTPANYAQERAEQVIEPYFNQRIVLLKKNVAAWVDGSNPFPSNWTDEQRLQAIEQLIAEGFLRRRGSVPDNLSPAEQAAWLLDSSNYRKRPKRTQDLDSNGVDTVNGRTITIVEANGSRVIKTIEDAFSDFANGIELGLDRTFDIDLGDIGRALGSVLGNRITQHPVGQVVASAALGAVLGAVGDTIDDAFAGELFENLNSVDVIENGLNALGDEFLGSLKSGGIGAVSSYLVSEIVDVVGIDGFAGQVVQSVGGQAVSTIITNIINARNLPSGESFNLFANVGPALVVSAVGNLLGNKLADEIKTFESVGGQIGSQVGAIIGANAAAPLLQYAAVTGNVAVFAAAVVIIALNKLIYGFVGSIFGGTPRSGADAEWDEATQSFAVGNVYSRKGGSEEAVSAIAGSVSSNLNSVLQGSGSRLIDPTQVQSGNYGMRKSTFVYRPVSTRDKSAITKSFKGADAAVDLLNYGQYYALKTMLPQMAGGDVFLKRALDGHLNGFEGKFGDASTLRAEEFDSAGLFGDLVVASDYATFFENSEIILSGIAQDSESSFSLGWLATLAKAHELGLHKRSATDWTGGYNVFLNTLEDGIVDDNSVTLDNVVQSVDFTTGQRTWFYEDDSQKLLGYVGDSIEFGTQTIIEGTALSDVITFTFSAVSEEGYEITGGAALVTSNSSDLVVNGELWEVTDTVNVAATVDAGGGDDIVHASDLGDNVFGGSGDDHLYGGRLDDWLLGGDGDDTLNAGAELGGLGGDGNYLNGGAGNDTLIGREGSDWLEGGDGADTITGGAGGDILTGGGDEFDSNGDWVAGDTLFGGAGDDSYLLRLGDGKDVVTDTDNTTLMWNASDNTYLAGFSDNLQNLISQRYDSVRDNGVLLAGTALGTWAAGQYAGNNQDWLGYYTPGASSGSLDGGEDSVVLGQGIGIGDIVLQRSETNGVEGEDLVIKIMTRDENGVEVASGDELTLENWFANPFDRIEWLKFADGNEIRMGDFTSFIAGTNGNDTLIGTLGNDFVHGGDGNDELYLLAGDDVGSGGTGRDFISGDSGDDLIVGGSDNDSITGAAGADTISGDGGDDEIYGGDGADLISGGRGDDWLAGGAGDDVFKYHRGDGHDTIIDEINGTWETVWTRAVGWATNYTVASDGTVTGPGGVLREDVGTSDDPRVQWNGRLEYDSGGETLRLFVPATTGSLATDGGAETNGDTIEFAPGILIQDIVLENRGDDLVMHVTSDQGASGSFGGTDSLTFRQWNAGAAGSIERLAFFSTGILDLSTTNLVVGSAENDAALNGGTTVDWITGGLGDDSISGFAGDDILSGNGGIDTIDAGAGDDVLYGGSGDDILIGGQGADLLIGGAGSDWASYENETAAITLSLANVSSASGAANGDSFSSIENLRGGSGDDELRGDAGENILDGGAGQNLLAGGDGDDTYIWAADGDVTIEEGLDATQVAMTAQGQIGPNFTGGWHEVGFDFSGNNENIIWEYQIRQGNLLAYAHSATIIQSEHLPAPTDAPAYINTGGWQNGFVQTSTNGLATRSGVDGTNDAGSDTIELSEGVFFDNLSFVQSASDLVITHTNGATLTIGDHTTDGGRVEHLQFHDGLAASLENLTLTGGSTAGDDLMINGASGSILWAADGNDVMFGGGGVDDLRGGAGDDILEGGAGADILNGGTNSLAADNPTSWGDTARYVGSSAGVTIDLALGTAQVSGGDGAGDTLIGIENVEGSWLYGDILKGTQSANRLFGHGGNDQLDGLGGEDVLLGGEGNDTLKGDGGEDNLSGGSGDDILYGGNDNDFLSGDSGNDFLSGEAGDDFVFGGAGQDKLFGGDGDDIISGGLGDDSGPYAYLEGGAGDDQLDGGAGDDDLRGGADNDTLLGGIGDDLLDGGTGDDIFVFGANDGIDTLTDTSGTNTIIFTEEVSRDNLWITETGGDLRIGVIGGDTVVTVSGFGSGSSVIDRIQTVDGQLLLQAASTTALMQRMEAISFSVTPEAMPGGIIDDLDLYWNAAESVAPRAPEEVQVVSVANYAANAINVDFWPDLPPSGRGENMLDDDLWPRDPANVPMQGSALTGWAAWTFAETRWTAEDATSGLYGNSIVSLAIGEIGDQDTSGGGMISAGVTVDPSTTQSFTWYFKNDGAASHTLYFGPGFSSATAPQLQNLNTGADDPYARFLTLTASQQDNNLVAGRWYKVEGYILPEGSDGAEAGTLGGVFDTTSGEKVLDLDRNYRWHADNTDFEVQSWATSSGSGGGVEILNTHLYQPEIRAIEDRYLVRDGEKLNLLVDHLQFSAEAEGLWNFGSYTNDNEARWALTEGPDGERLTVLEAGQFDQNADGGGNWSNDIAVDTGKTYRYTQYFKKTDLSKHTLFASVTTTGSAGAGKKRLSDGVASDHGTFLYSTTANQAALDEDKWYKLVGYILPASAPDDPNEDFGGVYDAETGQKVTGINVPSYRWGSGTGNAVSAFARFHTHGDHLNRGWSTQFGVPEFSAIPNDTLVADSNDPFGLAANDRSEATIFFVGGVTDDDNNIASYAINPDGTPAKGELTLVDAATGEFSYRPHAGTLGEDNFSVIVSDADGNSTIVPITVDVGIPGVNQAPDTPSEGFLVAIDENSALNATAGTLTTSDPDGSGGLDWRFSESLTTFVGGRYVTFSQDNRFRMERDFGNVVLNEGAFDYEMGQTEFTYDMRVSDLHSGKNSRSTSSRLTVQVADVNEAHSLTDISIDVPFIGKALGPLVPMPNTDGFAVNLRDLMLDDPEGKNMVWSLANSTSPGPWSIGRDGTLFLTGVAVAGGATPITVVATDSDGLSVQAQLTINVGADSGVPFELPIFNPFEFNFDYDWRDYFDVLPPIVFDLDGDGVELLSIAQSGARFDMDGDGLRDRTGWIGGDDALLALDIDGNGLIDQGLEISFQQYVEGAFSDLDGLAFFDTNANGLLDAGDERWDDFIVWQDADGDGVSTADEMTGLTARGITSIDLTGTPTGQVLNGSDNVLHATTTYFRDDGSQGITGDVFLVFDPAEPEPELPSIGDPVIDGGDTVGGDGELDTETADQAVMEFSRYSFDRKTKKYRITSSGGSLLIGPRGGNGALDSRAGQATGATMMSFNGWQYGMLSTVILDLDNDGIETKRYKKTRAAFDMDGNGSADNTGWTTGGDGFLVIDRNANGRIDDASEMSFADADGNLAQGRSGLFALDSNGDGVISADDELFGQLQIWVDTDRDGRTDAGELQSLSTHNIESITLAMTATEDAKKVGRNITLSTTVFNRTDGSVGTLGDVSLGFVPRAVPVATRSTLLNRGTFADNGPRLTEGMRSWLSEQYFRDLEIVSIDDLIADWEAGNFKTTRPELLPESVDSSAGVAAQSDVNNDDPLHLAPEDSVDGLDANRLALLRQDMAAFDGASRMHNWEERRDHVPVMSDFFV